MLSDDDDDAKRAHMRRPPTRGNAGAAHPCAQLCAVEVHYNTTQDDGVHLIKCTAGAVGDAVDVGRAASRSGCEHVAENNLDGWMCIQVHADPRVTFLVFSHYTCVRGSID